MLREGFYGHELTQQVGWDRAPQPVFQVSREHNGGHGIHAVPGEPFMNVDFTGIEAQLRRHLRKNPGAHFLR